MSDDVPRGSEGIRFGDVAAAAVIGIPPVWLAAIEGWPMGLTLLAALLLGLSLWSLAARAEQGSALTNAA